MGDSDSLIINARQRFADTDTPVLWDIWATDGRTEWAEAALRDELLARGVAASELDDVSGRRDAIRAATPPKASDTIFKYGFVGRIVAYGSALAWIAMAHAANANRQAVYLGPVCLVGGYIYVLMRRIRRQKAHPVTGWSSFAMSWQLGEAWLLLAIFVLAAL